MRNVIHVYRMRRHYRRLGYGRHLPCYHCIVVRSDDADTPYHWIGCDRCDWGNS